MRVLKKADVITLTALSLQIPEETVKQAVEFYWKEVITSVRELQHINIFIPEIGELRIAKSKLDSYHKKLVNRKSYLIDEHRIQDLETKIAAVERLMQLRDEEYQKRERIRSKRKDYDEAKKDLEGKVEDTGSPLV